MSNLDKANSVAHEWVESMGGLEAIRHDHDSDLSGLIQALDYAGLLMPDAQVISTVEELEALDPDTALMQHQKGYQDSYIDYQRVWVKDYKTDSAYIFPLAVMMDGAQVRAAREAMEEEHG